MGNDGLWEWWDKRSRSQITDVTITEDNVSFRTYCEYDDGMIVKIPMGSINPSVLPTCDGKPVEYEIRKDFGHEWMYIIVPKGTHTVSLSP